MLNIRCASSISALTGEIVYSQGIPNNEDKCKISEAFIVDCNKEYVLWYTATDSTAIPIHRFCLANCSVLQTRKVLIKVSL